MAEILLHSEAFGELALAPDPACLIVRWHGFANSQNLRLLLNKGLELYQFYVTRFPGLAWINDTRKFGAMLTSDQEWVKTNWNPRAYAAGIRQVNFLPPENVFGQIAIQQYTHNTAQVAAYRLQVRQYASFEEACQSIRSL